MFAIRMNPHRRTFRLLALFTLLATSLVAVDRTGPLVAAGASDDAKKAVEAKGYHVALDDGWSADFWFARALATSPTPYPTAAAGALYPDLANGEFVGVVTFTKGASDFRGQAIPAGTYTLRYQYIPQDANHMGVSPNPDFLLAIPIASDTAPADNLPLKRLAVLSAKSTGTAHPAVFAMAPAGSPSSVTKDDQGMTIFAVEVPTAAGKTEKISIIVKGQAPQ
ncbi:MAG TPA: hypothetical protein VE779_16515 [Candidatus Angelobacter sp.]|nr:hypothetical protein [Candidatus Angelobacter sp.]